MHIETGTLISCAGSLIFLFGYIMQIRRIMLVGSAQEISWGMLLLLGMGTVMYLGFFIEQKFVALSVITMLCLICIATIAGLKRFRRNNRGVTIE